jgi:hypothetical protein
MSTASSSLAVLLALALALALVAPASVGGVARLDTTSTASTPVQGVSENTTRVVRLTGAVQSSFQAPTVVVLDALEPQHTELETAYSLRAVDERLTAAPNTTMERRVLSDVLDRTESEIRELEVRERQARAAYLAGEITGERYARELAIINAHARVYERFLGGPPVRPSLFQYAANHPGVQDRVVYLREELDYLTGPIRDEMSAAVRGSRAPVRVYVAAADSGFTLSRIQPDGTFVRETYRGDGHDDDPAGPPSIPEIDSLVSQLYPWAAGENGSGGFTSAELNPPSGTVEATITHPHGRVIATIDSSTEQVYYEVQYKRLDALPVDYVRENTTEDTRVLVSRTYAGGPVQVRVLDVSGGNETAYVGVPVTLNGTTTHQTSPAGTAWFVSPSGEFTVTTSANNTDFNLTVSAS